MRMFRNDIEGLRGVAVLLVIIYHFNYSICSGGYIGVDIFFVISGYLITGVLLKDIDNSKFSFIKFYSNRCKRILPNSIAVLLLVIYIISKSDDTLYKLKVYKDCLIALLFSANTNYYIQSLDYYKSFEKPTPILHYWSLSLEEQFYFIYPFLIYLFHRNYISIVISILLFSSLFICIKYTYINKPFAYYIIFSRAWQLLSGCLTKKMEKSISFICLSNISLLVILIISNIYNKYIYYPGLYSVFPVLLSFMIIKEDTEFNTILDSRIIRKIGEVSYSLYLVHYPVIIFVSYKRNSLKSFMILAVSVILFNCIEKPFHYNNQIYDYIYPLIIFSFVICAMVVMLFTLMIKEKKKLLFLKELNKQYYIRIKSVINNFHKHTCYLCCSNEYVNYKFNKIFFVLGDSHSRVLIFSISYYAKFYGWKIYHRWIPAINIITNNIKLYESILGNTRYDLIITTYKYPIEEKEWKIFEKNFYKNIEYLLFKTDYIIVVDDNPSFSINPHQVIIKDSLDYELVNKGCIISPEFHIPTHKNIIHLNFSKYYYEKSKCRIIYNNTIMYFDNNHLSIEFMKIIGKELIKTILNIPNFAIHLPRANASYKCHYFIPQIDPHYRSCKRC